MLPKRRSRECSRFAGGQERGLSSCRIDLTASRPIQPRAAPLLRRAPPRPDPPVVCPGFGFDRSTGFDKVTTCALEETMDLRPFGKSAGFGKDGFDICSRETMDLAKKTPLLDMPLKKKSEYPLFKLISGYALQTNGLSENGQEARNRERSRFH